MILPLAPFVGDHTTEGNTFERMRAELEHGVSFDALPQTPAKSRRSHKL